MKSTKGLWRAKWTENPWQAKMDLVSVFLGYDLETKLGKDAPTPRDRAD